MVVHGTYNGLSYLISWKQGSVDTSGQIASPSSNSSSWVTDSQGNRYGGRYGSGYSTRGVNSE